MGAGELVCVVATAAAAVIELHFLVRLLFSARDFTLAPPQAQLACEPKNKALRLVRFLNRRANLANGCRRAQTIARICSIRIKLLACRPARSLFTRWLAGWLAPKQILCWKLIAPLRADLRRRLDLE